MAQLIDDLCKVSHGKRTDMTDDKSNPAFSLGGLQGNLFKLTLLVCSVKWQKRFCLNSTYSLYSVQRSHFGLASLIYRHRRNYCSNH